MSALSAVQTVLLANAVHCNHGEIDAATIAPKRRPALASLVRRELVSEVVPGRYLLTPAAVKIIDPRTSLFELQWAALLEHELK